VQFNISFHNISGEADLAFYDINGKNIWQKTIQTTTFNSLDLSSLVTGVYSYRVSKSGKLLTAGNWIKK
jgi:Secretion system C-terminal sorting domain